MLNKLISFSLRFKGVILTLACIFLGQGLYSLSQSRYDVFPEFAPPVVEIQTEAPGLSPEQVEVLVTQRIENALNGVAGMEAIRSNSIQGLSLVIVTLHAGSDIFQNRQAVAERLATMTSQLPQGVQTPVMSPLTSSTGDLMAIGLTSKKLSLMELRTLADWTVKQRLLAVPGVSKIGVFGGEVRQMQIQIHPAKLIQLNLSIENVLAAATRATGVRGGGFIDTEKQRILIQTDGQSSTAAELAKEVIIYPIGNGTIGNVTLGDVATVTLAPAPPISAASIMGEPGVVLNVWAQYGANTLETTQEIDRALQELTPLLKSQNVVLTPDLFRAANFIQTAVHNIKFSLMMGGCWLRRFFFCFCSMPEQPPSPAPQFHSLCWRPSRFWNAWALASTP